MENECVLENVLENDLAEIVQLAKENDGNLNFSVKYLQHWYFQNPFKQFSFWKVSVNNKIEGYATTNNFKYKINNEIVNVAMPQNVLTSENIRGKGMFGKLYFKTEDENINKNNVPVFLTFTNALSTPIFLSKFAYENGICPTLLFSLFSFIGLFKKQNYKKLNSFQEIDKKIMEANYAFPNALCKNDDYFTWRYSKYKSKEIILLQLNLKNNEIAYAILKPIRKKGVSFLVLLEMITTNSNNYAEAINNCNTFASKNFYVGVMLYQLHDVVMPKKIFQLKFENRFNFLVKGKTSSETKILATTPFNLFLGDMDIF